MGRRRRGGGDALTIIYWRDIPAQVTASSGGGETHKTLLEERFQHAIDRAATVAGLTETEAYVAQWRRATEPLEGDPAQAATRRADDLARTYPGPRLEALVAAGGVENHQRQPKDESEGS